MKATLLIPLAALLSLGCGDDTKDDTDSPGETGDTQAASMCPELTPVACEDDLVQDLLTDDGEISDGAVTTTTDGDDFVTVVDATAGGMNQAANNPWVYIRFDTDGANRVVISDEDALESAEWHMALRRFLLRMNSGDGGPSCVGIAKMGSYDYGDLTEEPSGVEYGLDDFYDDSCELQMDSYGMSPQFATYGWWAYAACVETTMVPFLVQLDDGGVLKLVVEEYYGSGQEDCNSTGTAGSDSGMIKLRWAFL
jgi:hypothetical protein